MLRIPFHLPINLSLTTRSQPTMSTLSRAIFRPLPNVTVSRPVAITNRRYFHVTRVRSALSESDRRKPLDSSSSSSSSPPLQSFCYDVSANNFLFVLSYPDRDDIHEEIEHHKNDQLEKQKNGKGEWKRELASNSEAAVCIGYWGSGWEFEAN